MKVKGRMAEIEGPFSFWDTVREVAMQDGENFLRPSG
jgi:hypothetical protein